MAIAQEQFTQRKTEYVIPQEYPYNADFANTIRVNEVCQGRQAAFGHDGRLSGYIAFGPDEGGPHRVLPRVIDLRAKVGGAIRDRLADEIADILMDDHHINNHELSTGTNITLLADARDKVFNGDFLVKEAAREVVLQRLDEIDDEILDTRSGCLLW